MRILITGGTGFIGCNTAKSFAGQGWKVVILDNLSRLGSKKNLDWLKHEVNFKFVKADIRNEKKINEIIAKGRFDVLIHLAGQVAVTTSICHPRMDFEINTLGTLNVLEAIRCYSPKTILLNASTNKVYGQLKNIPVKEGKKRYKYLRHPFGVAETQSLDFHSPYGCSKGAADQYVVDYARIYGLQCVNLRQSCIYGHRQFGLEDQGWLAWFVIAHVLKKPITIYGNGKQVRDVLFIDDLVAAFKKSINKIKSVSGMTFNIGGGRENSLSLLELIEHLENISGRSVKYSFSDWRRGDQRIYISDIRQAQKKLNWKPKISVKKGIARLYNWVKQNKALFVDNKS